MSIYGPSWRDDLYGDYIDTGDDLMHYGVLGMRWGHRKGSSGGSSAKQRLNDWGRKADARAKKDPNYVKSGQMGVDAEKAVRKYRAERAAERSKKRQSKGSKRLKKAAAVAGAAALAGGAAYLYSKNRNKGGNALAVVNNQPQQSIQKSAAQKRW